MRTLALPEAVRDTAAALDSKRIYFPLLDGLRFFAAFGVIVHHVEQYKFLTSHKNVWHWYSVSKLGPQCVDLFFVLSGFLITFLLFQEMKQTGTVHVKQFYLRRILRIWPLYFAVIAVGLFAVPFVVNVQAYPPLSQARDLLFANYWQQVILLFLFLPNLAFKLFGPVTCIGPCWSIGAEEQFYAVWPWVIRNARRYALTAMFAVIATRFMAGGLVSIFSRQLETMGGHSTVVVAKWLVGLFPAPMAIGGIAAWILFNNSTALRKLTSKAAFSVAFAGAAALLFVPQLHALCGLSAVLFACLILQLAVVNASRLPGWIQQLLPAMGNMSYAMYMLHCFIILVSIKAIEAVSTEVPLTSAQFSLCLYLIVIGGTIIVSALCYRFFELPFLQIKKRFALIRSGST